MSGNADGAQTLGEPTAEDDRSWAIPVLRTINTQSGRHALRLEAAFWSALADIAARDNRKTIDLVREVLGEARPAGVNLSSAVRSSVVKRLLDRNAAMAAMADPLAMVKVMQMAPMPSFALDRSKQLVRVNEEFVRYLRTVISGDGPVEKAQLRLDRPTETLLAEVEPGTAVECGLSIRVDNRERRTQARIVVVPSSPVSILVGFIRQ